MNPNSPNSNQFSNFPPNVKFAQGSSNSKSQEALNLHSQSSQHLPHQYQGYFHPNAPYMVSPCYPYPPQIGSEGAGHAFPNYQNYILAPGLASSNSQNSADQSPNTPTNVKRHHINVANEDDANNIANLDGGKSYVKWSTQDNINLISCWLEVSKDAIIGTDQTNTKLWDRIAALFNQNDKSGKYRPGSKAKSHWNRMSAKIQHFSANYNRVKQRQQSGTNEDDVIREAHMLYESSNNGTTFQFLNVWRILRNEPKWLSVWGPKNDTEGCAKRVRISETGSYISSETSETRPIDLEELQEPERPTGIKAAKRKGKKKLSYSEDKKVEILEKVLQKLDAAEEYKVQMKREKLKIQKEKMDRLLEIENKKAATELDEKFLKLDISLLPPKEQEVANQKKLAIIRKMMMD